MSEVEKTYLVEDQNQGPNSTDTKNDFTSEVTKEKSVLVIDGDDNNKNLNTLDVLNAIENDFNNATNKDASEMGEQIIIGVNIDESSENNNTNEDENSNETTVNNDRSFENNSIPGVETENVNTSERIINIKCKQSHIYEDGTDVVCETDVYNSNNSTEILTDAAGNSNFEKVNVNNNGNFLNNESKEMNDIIAKEGSSVIEQSSPSSLLGDDSNISDVSDRDHSERRIKKKVYNILSSTLTAVH